jgi:hypothetical protein
MIVNVFRRLANFQILVGFEVNGKRVLDLSDVRWITPE